jgi:hypothetical protein
MTKFIILVSVLCVVAITLVSCASEPQKTTTTTTTRQTTTTTRRPMQPIGYQRNNIETEGTLVNHNAVDTICACP